MAGMGPFGEVPWPLYIKKYAGICLKRESRPANHHFYQRQLPDYLSIYLQCRTTLLDAFLKNVPKFSL